MVGERGFEPPTPWSRTRCSTRLSHSPTLCGGAECALETAELCKIIAFGVTDTDYQSAMSFVARVARRLLTPIEEISDPLLFVEDGRISEVSSCSHTQASGLASIVDFGDAVLAPGFFDINMHGGAGLDLMRASPSELPRLGAFLTKHGVTGYFPTTVAAPLDTTCAALERLADAIESAQKTSSSKDRKS